MALTPNYAWPLPDLTDPANVPADLKAFGDAVDATLKTTEAAIVPVGALLLWATAVAPQFWILCDGRTVDAATYPQLADVLGQAGGLVTIPDLRNRVPRGAGTVALGSLGGGDTVTLTAAQIPAHTHTMANAGTHRHGGSTNASDRSLAHGHGFSSRLIPAMGDNGFAASPVNTGTTFAVPQLWGNAVNFLNLAATDNNWAPDHLHGINDDGLHAHAINNSTGGGGSHDNWPPYRAINYIIKAG